MDNKLSCLAVDLKVFYAVKPLKNAKLKIPFEKNSSKSR